MKKIILASASPRRKKLLEGISVPFTVMTTDVEEELHVEGSPYEWVKYVSAKKANAVVGQVDGPAIIIAADTIVTYLGKIMEKPKDAIDAFHMLKILQGKKHSVYTGLTILYKGETGVEEETYVDATDVYMHTLTDAEIKKYLDTKESFDKAGGYAIQGKGALLIDSIYGDYNTVVGLPLNILFHALKAHGIDLMDYWEN